MTQIVEDFEDTTYTVVITGSWERTNTTAYAGSWCLRSPANPRHNATYDATITVPPGATELVFWYRVSTEAGYDLFQVLVGGQVVLTDSGQSTWKQTAVINVTGQSTVTLRYSKDVSVSEGQDAVFVDDIVFTVPGPADTEPPTAPQNLRVTGKTAFTVDLEWDPASDNVAVTGYDVHRDGGLVSTVTGTTCTDQGLAPETTYTYTVAARDAAGNASPPSTPVTVTTNRFVPPPGVQVDPSTPPLVSGAADVLATQSFTAPAGSLLVACCAFGGNQHPTVANTGQPLTWVRRAALGPGDGGENTTATIYTALVPAAQTLTVTATSPTSGNTGALMVYVVTGVDSEPVGATGVASFYGETPWSPTLLSTTKSGSRVFLVASNWYSDTINTIDAAFTGVPFDTYWCSGIVAYQAIPTTTPGPVTVTLNNDLFGGIWRGNVAAIEVLPGEQPEEPAGPPPFHAWGIPL